MIAESKNGRKWVAQAMDKLHSYLSRAPIIVTDITSTNGDGVYILHDDSKTKEFFQFDIDEEAKVWVHQIKEKLLFLYPRIIENVSTTIPTTSMDKAMFLEKGGKLNEVPATKDILTCQRLWRVDKVQLYKNIFILQLEGTRENPEGDWNRDVGKIPIQNRYKYQSASVFFLSKYRNNEFKDEEEAGKFFFDNSIFIDEVQGANVLE